MCQKNELINKFPKVFADAIGTIKSSSLLVKLKKDAKLLFLRDQIVPFALRKFVDLELDGLMSEILQNKLTIQNGLFLLLLYPNLMIL